MDEPTLPPLPLPKVRRHLTECAVFDPTRSPCDCGSPPKVYDQLEMESYATRAIYADRAARGVDVPAPAHVCGEQGFDGMKDLCPACEANRRARGVQVREPVPFDAFVDLAGRLGWDTEQEHAGGLFRDAQLQALWDGLARNPTAGVKEGGNV